MCRLTALLSLLFLTLATHAQLVPEGAVPEKVADGYKFTEGPALGPDGCIYFTDIPAELILKFDPESGETVTYTEKSGQANGLMFDDPNKRAFYSCNHRTRDISLRFQGNIPNKAPQNLSLWQEYEGKRLNSPNDLTIAAGGIYFTDPRYGNRDSMELDFEGVFFVPDTVVGQEDFNTVKLIDADLTRPNGIMLSPDESTLYVADQADNFIYAYDIVEPGNVKNKRVFARLNNGKGHGSDGMTVDKQGRLYATGHGKVWAFEPTGQLVATLPVGKHTTNVTFGADGKTLYITANKGLYRITLDTDTPLRHAEKIGP